MCYQFLLPTGTVGNPCAGNSTTVIRKPMCLDVNGPFPYGIYQWALPVVSSRSITVKILYPIFWGLMTLRWITSYFFIFNMVLLDHLHVVEVLSETVFALLLLLVWCETWKSLILFKVFGQRKRYEQVNELFWWLFLWRLLVKILHLQLLVFDCSTFGNDLEPTSHWLEVIFSICLVLSGLMLFTLLIGNIQVSY